MAKAAKKSGGSGSALLVGLLVGVIFGVLVAVGVALYLSKNNTPFLPKTPPPDALPKTRPAKPAKPEVLRPGGEARASGQASEGTHYDFYRMLQGNEKPDTRPKPAKPTAVPVRPLETFLQVGAFQKEDDADNLKAKLALLGIEARIQTSEISGKGLWHRVRIGPLATSGELANMRATLKHNGIDSTVVKSN